MIKRFIVYIICIILMNFVALEKETSLSEKEFNELEYFIKSECLEYKEGENILIVFDYKKIELYIDKKYINISLEKVSSSEIIIKKEIKKGIFLKEKSERIFIRKGDFYDGGN